MNRRWLLIAGIVLVCIGVAGFFITTKLRPSQAGILIETNPQAMVYINDEEVGTTPFDKVQEAGEVTVRLVPIATSGSLAPWGTKLTLVSGIKTVIKRDFGEVEAQSSGEVLSFEKIAGDDAALTIVSSPDASQVSVDGQIKGFTPLPIDPISIGEHQIVVSQPGYAERTINARTYGGYKLTVVAMLAQVPTQETQEIEEASPSAEVAETQKVTISETPVGFLRVRFQPTTSSTEAGQVKPGEQYDLLEESDDGGWYKIEYTKGKQGWVSSQYAEKDED